MYVDDKGREYTILEKDGIVPFRVAYRKNPESEWRYIPTIPWEETLEDAIDGLEEDQVHGLAVIGHDEFLF